ncbi:RNA methyltransferase, putative [Plasmodium malariae]|uniref:RNA methyltransferase, putative n=1 Tax=Plasmodium malariae TaxID=5858 RepID=A0A1C3KE28_PLAMA|nr:RNA methyltransferase, putative [Plasmodium malariae]
MRASAGIPIKGLSSLHINSFRGNIISKEEAISMMQNQQRRSWRYKTHFAFLSSRGVVRDNKMDTADREGIEANTVAVNAGNDKIKMYVVIYNIGKKKNVGSIIRSCVAFNVNKIFLVGRRKNEINFFGNMGTYKYIRIEHFNSMTELKNYLNDNNILLYGCEITSDSVSVTTKPFLKKDTAFIFGNEGTGIEDSILNLCDKIIYIPQYGNGTASLNVSVSCSIILHNFAVWANYKELKVKDKKFIFEKCKSKLDRYLHPSDHLLKEINDKRSTRAEKKKKNNNNNTNNFYLNDFTGLSTLL